MRSAAGARPASDCTGPLRALPMCLANAPFAKWSLRRSFSGNSSLVDGGNLKGENLTRKRRPLSRRLGSIRACMQRAPHAARTSCHAQARLLGAAAKYSHHQPEAAPLAPRGRRRRRWAQSPGPASRGPGRACNFEDTPASSPEPPRPAYASTAQKRRSLQVPHLDPGPRAPESESRPGSRLAGVGSLLPVSVTVRTSGPGPGPQRRDAPLTSCSRRLRRAESDSTLTLCEFGTSDFAESRDATHRRGN
jgi:hypothetical protein